jgi:putative CocE/NonD family hydrolase
LFVSSNCTDTDFTVKITDGTSKLIPNPSLTLNVVVRCSCVVYPNGESHLIQDGGIRMRYVLCCQFCFCHVFDQSLSKMYRWRYLDYGAIRPTPMTPGVVYRGDVSLWNTSYVFAAGHRIRVSISSSNAPRFSVNPNNGATLTQNGTLPVLVAANTVYQSPSYASHIDLPLVSLSQLPPLHVTMPKLEQLVGVCRLLCPSIVYRSTHTVWL